ncbi:phenylalanine--tRNA ligase subunit beta [Desulfitobacterium metallireducens]|uniref:Phenylalanine--tRNA ligase beta subunit n=1 Tax=Desulfitobacterium metallireducens DSM 15288 TaxID=871968 RepID=W0E8D6_9FIRM|nr:phenylalanine--tRNA ligase subunit beta [Desulfitobacterium metallireducens]AHF05768.1 phenylalanyl-tRNA synthetase subunit beta [Desulfitobacterium metallireducens DSM 15288]
MKVSLEWLREFIDVLVPAEELAEILTRGGIEIGGIEQLNQGLEAILVGEIESMEHHPNADKLWICQVNLGSQNVQIVTGAQNLLLKDKIPVATHGTTLPTGQKIRKSKLRGVESNGMLCSTDELLLDSSLGDPRSEDGIMILPPEALIGKSLAELIQGDTILDLDLYPNRPDCLAMNNVAREVSSLTREKVHLNRWAETEQGPDYPADLQTKIVIEEPELCHRYAALLVEEVKIEPSPEWMQKRLIAAGVRPISNIVDITNYCMLEMGQPLHAFDRDKVTGAVHVRRAAQGEKLMTLDNVERTLDPEMLLIADDEKALGLAGVMGGLDSEITEATTRILVESAHFDSVSIRRTSRRLGLRSEASNRFEKGINVAGIAATLGRVGDLILKLGAGKPVGFVDENKVVSETRTVVLTVAKTGSLLGMNFTLEEVADVLERLQFPYERQGEGFLVTIPSYRSDIQIEEDMIEEVARLTGYDRIPTTLPQGSTTQGRRTPEQEFRRKLRHLLANLGLNEVITYSFNRPNADELWGHSDQSISIMNPLREELSVMRTTLIPGLLEVASRNVARRNLDVCIFEIGNVFWTTEQHLTKLPEEKLRLAGLLHGKPSRHWLKSVSEYNFYTVKGIIEELAQEFGLKLKYQVPQGTELLHPGRSAEIYLQGKKVGFMGELHPMRGKDSALEHALVFEIELAPLFAASDRSIRATSIPRYPAIQRDLAVVVSKDVSARDVMARIHGLGGALLDNVDIFDVYTGKPIAEGHKSLAFTMRYQSLERTLTDEEVTTLNKQILEGIEKEFGAESRK